MTTTFQLNASELNSDFLKALKLLFQNQRLTLTIESELLDTTSHLLSNGNKDRLLESIKNINLGRNTTEMSLESLKTMTNA